MKILFLANSLDFGGAERVAITLCNAWGARGDTVTLVPTYSGGGSCFFEVSEAVELIQLADIVDVRHKSLWTYIRRLHALRRLISDKNPDVIVSFLPNVNVAAVVSSAFLRIPLIICERSDPSACPHPPFWMMLSRLFYAYADMLTVQTESLSARVGDIYPRLSRVRSIPNPLPSAISAIRAKLCNERKILLSIGRLAPEKQIDKLLLAFAKIAPSFEDWDLHIYGDGPVKGAIEEQIKASALSGRCFLKGVTNCPWEIMAGADAFALVSRYEGFPNALLEAMGVGLPCVVVDCPSGPREITRNGKDALLVPCDDHTALVAALTEVMGDAQLRCLLGKQARESVFRRFNLPEVIHRWDLLFQEVGAAC